MKKAIVLGPRTPSDYKTDYKQNTDHFGVNEISFHFNTEFSFVDNYEDYNSLLNGDGRRYNFIISKPFLKGESLHVSEYYESIKFNENEDVNKLVDLTDGEIRYHLLQAVKKNPNFYFPSYHSSVSLLIFYLIWHDYRVIHLLGCEVKPSSQEDKVKADYANRHINRLLEFVKELGIEIQAIQ